MLFKNKRSACPPRRVVVTGAGIITCLGAGWDVNLDGFRRGRSGFRPVSRFDVSRQRAKVAAEADLPASLPPTKMSARHIDRLEHSGKLLLVAASEAWNHCGWAATDSLPMIFGTSAAGMSLGEDYYKQAVASPKGHGRDAHRVLYYYAQMQLRCVSAALGFSGPITIVSNACAAGTNAVGLAWEMIRTGRAERALAGGYEAICQTLFTGFDSLQALSVTSCKPFDRDRDGLGMGEGAAVLALESLESATRRGASILGEVCGYGSVIDLHHLTQPHPRGDAALRSMTLACDTARVAPGQIDYINAHGTGTLLNDSSEAQAIHRWGGDHAGKIPVSSTKAGVGHMLGAAGAVEALVCLMALRGQFLPPETSLENPDPICGFPLVMKPSDARLNYVLSNSFGFGGVNASIVLGRWE